MLPVHSQNFPTLRKNSFKRACRRVIQQQAPVSYRGQPLTPQLLRRTGSCPPAGPSLASRPPPRSRRAGQQARPIRVISWNAGHLGQQQWAEIKTWLQLEASKVCDVLILQETHWQESAEFTVSGWYCITSASKRTASQRKPRSEGKKPAGASVPSKAPSVTNTEGLMVLLPERMEHRQSLGGPGVHGRLSHHALGSLPACLVFQQDTAGQPHYREAVLSSLRKAVQQAPKRDTLIVAGDFNSSTTTQSLVGPQTAQPEDRPASLTNLISKLQAAPSGP